VRREQAARVCSWMDAVLANDDGVSAVILAGDLNAPPGEPAQRLLQAWGLQAAHARGASVAQPTWPTPSSGAKGARAQALDFILVRAMPGVACIVADSHLVGRGRTADVYASDHWGVLARLIFTRSSE
jgi:endonuclease/exonuclease/phosphatase family metal-dependent hydrolase